MSCTIIKQAMKDKSLPVIIPSGKAPNGLSWNSLAKKLWTELRKVTPLDPQAVLRIIEHLLEKEAALARLVTQQGVRLSETTSAMSEISHALESADREITLKALLENPMLPLQWEADGSQIKRLASDKIFGEELRADIRSPAQSFLHTLGKREKILEKDFDSYKAKRAMVVFQRTLKSKALEYFESTGSIPPWSEVPTTRKVLKAKDAAHETTIKVARVLEASVGYAGLADEQGQTSGAALFHFEGIEHFKKFMASQLHVSPNTIYQHLEETGVWIKGKRGSQAPDRIAAICKRCLEYAKDQF